MKHTITKLRSQLNYTFQYLNVRNSFEFWDVVIVVISINSQKVL